MSDARVKELREEYIKSYKIKYGVEPMWAYGKNDKLVQNIWIWADKNGQDSGKIYGALLNWFSDDGFAATTKHDFGAFYKGIHKYLEKQQTPEQKKAYELIEKAKAMFGASQARMEEKLTVVSKSEDELLKQFELLYPSRDHETALRWANGHRYTYANSELIKDETSLVYQRWISHGKLARKYFGDELISQVWKETKPAEATRKSISEAIKKAKEIEQNS